MFENFTERSIKVIMLAQEESRRLGHNFVGTEQILLGLIGEGTGVAAKVLKPIGVNLKNARIEVERIIGRGSGIVAIEIPFTPRAMKLLQLAQKKSSSLGDNSLKTEHLLLGLIEERESVGARVLEILGADLAAIRNQVIQMLNKSNSQVENPNPSKPQMSERFTDRAVKAMMLAQEESRRLGHNSVGLDQILLGLIAERTGVAAKVLISMGVNLKEARTEVEKIIGRGSGSVAVEIPLTPRAKKVLEFSLEETRKFNDNFIRTEHLLLGLIRDAEVAGDGGGVAGKVLHNLGVDLWDIRQQVMQILGKDSNEPQNPQQNKNINDYSNSKSTITLEVIINAGLIDTLANIFYQEEEAEDLLIKIKFPLGRKPNFNKFYNSYHFWKDICKQIDSGILDSGNSYNGFKLLVEQALTIYSSSDKLKEIQDKYFSE